MQVDVDPGPGWVAVDILMLSVVEMFVHSQLLLVNDLLVDAADVVEALQVVGPLIVTFLQMLEVAEVLVLVTDAEVVDVTDVVVEVEEAVDEQGPLDG